MTDGLQTAVMKCATGWASFSSCSTNEVAHESGELNQGVFTYYLCEGLSGKAKNQQGNITIEGLVNYVKTSVGNWCDRQTLRQTPHFQSDLSGTLVLGTSLRTPAEETMPLASPFTELIAGIEQHLSSTPEDTRRLTLTSDEEWQAVTHAICDQLKTKLAELSSPAIAATLSGTQPLQSYGHPSWPAFQHAVASCSLQTENTNQTEACIVDFRPTEIVLPVTKLYVTIVKFKFFYWLWYFHHCQPQQLQGSFQPDPPYTTGFFTFKPSGARDKEKTDQTLNELLSRSSREILTWAKQLGQYAESRIEPLRKLGAIIE